MRTLLSLTLLCTSAAGAPVPKELRKQDRIVGVWKLESATIGGMASIDPGEIDWKIDESFALHRGNSQKGPQTRLVQLKIDTVAKEIDWPESTFLGRYEVRGDQLTICVNGMNLPRPTSLEPNTGNYVWVLSRAEK